MVALPTLGVYVQKIAAIYQGWLNSKVLNKKLLIGIHVLNKECYISDLHKTRKIKRTKIYVFVYFRSFIYLREGMFSCLSSWNNNIEKRIKYLFLCCRVVGRSADQMIIIGIL